MTCLRNHSRGADLLIGYLEDSLAPSDLKELNSHALDCAECRDLLGVQATLDDAALDISTMPEVSVGFDARLYAKISDYEAQRQSSWWRKWVPRSLDGARDSMSLNPWTAGVATAGAALAVGLLVMGPGATDRVTTVEPASSQVQNGSQVQSGDLKQASVDRDIEQLERDLDDLELLMPVAKVIPEDKTSKTI
ncbi:MAG: hypothetical protein ABI824_15540 [Acidobacteriota bacterium]